MNGWLNETGMDGRSLLEGNGGMSHIGELECIHTKNAKKIRYPVGKKKYLVGRCSKEAILSQPDYYHQLPAWVQKLISETNHSIVLGGFNGGREKNYISRAQLWIEPENGFAKIIDLNSENRTYVNGRRIQADKDTYEVRYIMPEDTVAIGAGVINLKYRPLPHISYPNHALFVGYGDTEDDLQLIRNNVDALKQEVARRGFAGNIFEIIGFDAIKKDIFDALTQIVSRVAEDAILMFYFAGYNQKKRSVKLKVLDGTISCKELFDHLKGYMCQKLFIVDGPHTSGIGRHELPPRSIFIGNMAEFGEGEIRSRDGNVMRYLTRAICKALKGEN
ncbi:MAG: FHA domain-containing protein, partial [Deltaproteobacteria bacterium]|nr:FHA domain-containing protein [Deltaproteobacteria bacterium]